MLSDTTVVFRYYKGELPYIKAFLYHYISLQARQLVGIVQSSSDELALTEAFSRMDADSTSLHIIRRPVDTPPNVCLMMTDFKAIPDVSKWLLNVDVDEFIFNKRQKPGDQLYSSCIPTKIDRLYIKWVMVSNPLGNSHLGIDWPIGKDIAKSKNITGMPDVHRFTTKRSTKNDPGSMRRPNSRLRLAHHWGRTIKDTIIKMAFQQITNSKNIDFDGLDSFIKMEELPRRLRFMAFLESLPGDMDISRTLHPQLYDLEAEDALVSSVASPREVDFITDLYNEYVDHARSYHEMIFSNFVGAGVNAACERLPSLQSLREMRGR